MKNLEKALSVEQLEERFEMSSLAGLLADKVNVEGNVDELNIN